jgi:hypothetical protein
MDQITIAGHVFNVPVRYNDGDEINANEAAALNQTYHENLRNNFAKRVDEGTKNGKSLDQLQSELDEYAAAYQFGVRTGGGVVRDPVMSEAMSIAKTKIREHLKKKGRKLKDILPSALTEAARKLIEKSPEILELAKQRVAEAQAAAAEDLDSLVAGIESQATA